MIGRAEFANPSPEPEPTGITIADIFTAYYASNPRLTEWRMTRADAEAVWALVSLDRLPGVPLFLVGVPVVIDEDAPPLLEQFA